ncbi:MAG: ATP-binding cassette domain-containing protein [Clostridium sp.]
MSTGYILETHNLKKKFKDTIAVDSINVAIKDKSIYGLIGNNGAGKTTLLKLIFGMIKPTEGEINFYDNNVKVENKSFFSSIGSLIESPGLMLNMSAKDNIKAKCLCLGYKYSKSEIVELLKQVGLEAAMNKRAKDYSLGMKQRLGIALALVGNPKLLVLDEPINGLDPEGIMDIRNLLLKLNKEKNITIIISSHLLDELSKIATDFCIIHKGNAILQKTKEEFIKESNGIPIDEYYLKIVRGEKL